MTYTINGKQYTEDDINVRCAEILGIDVSESVMQFGSCYIPTGRGLIDENFMQYNPCTNPADAWPIIDKCWDELMSVPHFFEGLCMTKWECIENAHECTKLEAACICLIESNEK